MSYCLSVMIEIQTANTWLAIIAYLRTHSLLKEDTIIYLIQGNMLPYRMCPNELCLGCPAHMVHVHASA